ncbi:MAG TPA: serine/threonine-protein kinase [Chthoniobacterales bacterium]|nr:serine/threonine-protein kinase [Chthoniobacterales bacterium]
MPGDYFSGRQVINQKVEHQLKVNVDAINVLSPGTRQGDSGTPAWQIRTCPVCKTKFSVTDNTQSCPVCMLRQAFGQRSTKPEDIASASASEDRSDQAGTTSLISRFENYEVMSDPEGRPIELGRGAMGVTYKAFDINLRVPVALKVINDRYVGDQGARLRFVREARAAASVRHPNVASVFHLGISGREYFYAMEFVEGQTLERTIRRSGRLEVKLALEITAQVAAGLVAVQSRHLVHRDIKPSNIMVRLQDQRLEEVKIIDLGLAKGVADENTLSIAGAFVGTPPYASPEQFAGIAIDIRSDLYSLGVTLWEMVGGNLPFTGCLTEIVHQHKHIAPPTENLRGVPAPVITLLQILLEKDPSQRIQNPAQLRDALTRVNQAIATNSPLTAPELRKGTDRTIELSLNRNPGNRAFRWLAAAAAGLLLGALLFYARQEAFSRQPKVGILTTQDSFAVLPFESLSDNKADTYFADGIQDEILCSLAKVSHLKIISRTSVMRFRPGDKRNLHSIAESLGVTNVVEGTVRRDGNRVRITVRLVEAKTDKTLWSASYDRLLTDIFAIQSEIAESVAATLRSRMAPQEDKQVEPKGNTIARFSVSYMIEAVSCSSRFDQ